MCMRTQITMKSWMLLLMLPSYVLLSSQISSVTQKGMPTHPSIRSLSSSLSSANKSIGYTVSSESYFSRVTRTFEPGRLSKALLPTIRSSTKRSPNHEKQEVSRPGLWRENHDSHEEVEDYSENVYGSLSPDDQFMRRDMASMAAINTAKMQNKMNMKLSMTKMKMKYKLKMKKMKYKFLHDTMKYKLKKKGCGMSCKMSVPQLVNFQKISYKKVPVPVHYKLYKRMMQGKVPLGEPYGEPFEEPESHGFGGGYGEHSEPEAEPESWYGTPLKGIPEPFPEIAFPLPEPEIHINKKFVSYNYIGDYGGPSPTQPIYVYEEYYYDDTPASNLTLFAKKK